MVRVAIPLVLGLWVALPASAQTPFENKVNAAIDRGCKALLAKQTVAGAFNGGLGDHALITLSLLHSKVDPKSPAMRRALRPLRAAATTNYERAVRLMVAELLREPGLRPTIEKDLADLAFNQARAGGWDYGAAGERTDNSCTQYAMLGLRAADKLGMQTRRITWRNALKYVLNEQEKNGGVAYQRGTKREPSASMTAGAVSSFVAAMARAGYRDSDRRLGRARRAVRSATQWLEEHWQPGRGPHPYYTLYGIERAMAFSGQDRLGERDWYREGATYLLKVQAAGGLWRKNTRSTAFALLFLSKASKPTAGETPGSVSTLMASLSGQSRKSDITAVVAALAKKGKKIAPQLVHYLSDGSKARRSAAVLALRRITGRKCGYEIAWPVSENAAAIKAWKTFTAAL